MKEIVIVGNDQKRSTVLQHIHNSSNYKIKKAKNLEKAEKIIGSLNPDFVLCAGKITIDDDGNYVLELD